MRKNLDSLFNQAPAAIAVVEGDSLVFTFANTLYQKVFNRTEEQLIGQPFKEVFPEIKGQGVYDDFEKAYHSGEAFSASEYPVTFKRLEDNPPEKGFFNVTIQPIKDPETRVTSLFIHAYEVTEQVRLRKQVEKNEEQLRIALEGGELGLFDFFPKEGKLQWSARTKEFFGLPQNAEVSLNTFIEGIVPEDLGRARAILENALKPESGGGYENIYRVKGKKDGKIRWIRAKGQTYFDSDGTPVRMTGIAQEITKRKQAEAELKESEERFIGIFNQTTAGIAQTFLNGKYLLVNDRYCEMVGRSHEELSQLKFLDITHPDDRKENIPLIEKAIKEGKSFRFEKRYIKPDNSIIWVNASVSIIKEGNKPAYILGVFQDITEKKQAEQALIESEKRFRNLSDQVPQFIWMTEGVEPSISYVNKTFLNFLGLDDDKNLHGFSWEKYVHPEDIANIFTVYTSAVESLKASTVECRFLEAKTNSYRWVLIKGVPRFRHQNIFEGFIGTGIDIDDQKKFSEQLKQKNSQLLRVNNDLDNFIYTASHDLKAPISNLEGLLNALDQSLGDSHGENDHISSIVSFMHLSVERFKNTIQDLTEIAKIQSVEEDLSEVSFKELLEEVKSDISDLIKEADAIIKDNFSLVPTIYFSQKNLRSVLYNLVSNAVKYRSPDRPAEVEISTCLTEDNMVLLTVRDNGLGIKEEDKPKVFTMFKRLNQNVEGTGIGMSIVKRIIDNNEGKIEIDSEVGKGSTFKVYFKTKNS